MKIKIIQKSKTMLVTERDGAPRGTIEHQEILGRRNWIMVIQSEID